MVEVARASKGDLDIEYQVGDAQFLNKIDEFGIQSEISIWARGIDGAKIEKTCSMNLIPLRYSFGFLCAQLFKYTRRAASNGESNSGKPCWWWKICWGDRNNR